ncbi:MAG: hypothetical protein ACRCXB_30435, partial [Aeromonadaceae bacterium]
MLRPHGNELEARGGHASTPGVPNQPCALVGFLTRFHVFPDVFPDVLPDGLFAGLDRHQLGATKAIGGGRLAPEGPLSPKGGVGAA